LTKPQPSPTILALETAIGGGSICVYRDNRELASIAGDDSVSRSEELLPNIKTLLAQVDIKSSDIDLVAVSRGPGSFTGIRIGLATALGLARSLDIRCIGVPVMDAVAAANQDKFPLAVVLPMGKHEVVWKTFSDTIDIHSDKHGSVCSINEIWSMVDTATTAFVHESLSSLAQAEPPASAGGMVSTAELPSRTIGLLTPNLAKFIACEANRWSEKIDMSPIYIQNPAKGSNLF
jgi:tRNA threonylcarbamoyl adenosine modification protein YeaZ